MNFLENTAQATVADPCLLASPHREGSGIPVFIVNPFKDRTRASRFARSLGAQAQAATRTPAWVGHLGSSRGSACSLFASPVVPRRSWIWRPPGVPTPNPSPTRPLCREGTTLGGRRIGGAESNATD